MRKNEILFWIVVVIAFAQHVWQIHLLPEKMATHFNWEGYADGYAPRDVHMWMMLVVYGIMAFSFGLLPHVITKVPPSLVNLPRKDYWLAPVRVKATLQDIRDRMAWLGIVVFLFFMVVGHLVSEANKLSPPRLPDAFLWCLGIFLTITVVWSIRFIRDYYRVPKD
ncbi:MAG: DUF1648 domain-containing protein [Bdellovibrionaceae bacterium]|nr:DUF1648 domain-containing protein [Bdellovibrionales bacterium]MCB9085067.1 DUF1648 domain-containing protein [Pseudobdellovibrionaceae bacterium]